MSTLTKLVQIRATSRNRASVIPEETVDKLLFVYHCIFNGDERAFLQAIAFYLFSPQFPGVWQVKVDRWTNWMMDTTLNETEFSDN